MGITLALGLAACGGGNNANNNNNNGGATATNDAETIVQKNCINCHGDNLEGRNGPPLDHIGSELSKDEILKTIQEGKGAMPPNIIKGDDAEKVATWLSEKK